MTDDDGHFQIRAIVFSDDIRREEFNHQSLMGVFISSLQKYKAYPRRIRIGTTVFYTWDKPGLVKLDIEFSGDPLARPILASGVLKNLWSYEEDDINKTDVCLSAVGAVTFEIRKPGLVEVRSRQNDGEWQLERVLKFAIRETPMRQPRNPEVPSA